MGEQMTRIFSLCLIILSVTLICVTDSTVINSSSISCPGSSECYGYTLVCPIGSNCTIDCGSQSSCQSATIKSQGAQSLTFTPSGRHSFRQGTLYLPNNNQNNNDGTTSSFHSAKVYCNGEWSCAYAQFYGSYFESFYIDCPSFNPCEVADFFFDHVCLIEIYYHATDVNVCQGSDYVFDNVDMVYGNEETWTCICDPNSNSLTWLFNSTVVVINGTIKTQAEIEACTKFSNGDITIIDYNPNGISTVDTDNIKTNCKYVASTSSPTGTYDMHSISFALFCLSYIV